MAKDSAILVIDGDADDVDITRQAFQELGVKNKIDHVDSGEDALRYLVAAETPCMILCDYKLPRMNGIELRQRIEEDEVLRAKAIPFIYFSTVVSQSMVEQVYKMNVQGLFEKGENFSQIKAMLKEIFNYWQLCKHPNS